jgi:uncharacterized protein (DUF697 family)
MSVNKKKLPRVIRPAADEFPPPPAGRDVSKRSGASASTTAIRKTTGEGAPKPPAAQLDDVIKFASTPQDVSLSVTNAAIRAAPMQSEVDAAWRLSLARALIERHAIFSAIGGIIPLPIVNVSSVTAVIVRMVKLLSELYRVPFERDRANAIVIGLMGGAMPTGLAAVTTSTLVYIIPGSNLIGLAVSSIAAGACTRSIGRLFLERFESGATLNDF